MFQDDVFSLGGTLVVVGLSALVKIGPTKNLINQCIKMQSGGGTLEIVPLGQVIALSGSSAIGWGTGYPIGANEIISIGGPAIYYLAATGATMTAAILDSYSAGLSLAV